jgi:hypothetical protein
LKDEANMKHARDMNMAQDIKYTQYPSYKPYANYDPYSAAIEAEAAKMDMGKPLPTPHSSSSHQQLTQFLREA